MITDRMEDVWRFQLFGSFVATYNNNTISRFRTAKSESLLVMLVLQSSNRISRDSLIDYLWPENTDFHVGRARLRQELYVTRSTLSQVGPDPLIFRSGYVGFAAGITSDVSEFNALCKRVFDISFKQTTTPHERISILEKAIDLYKGDLVPRLYDNHASYVFSIERERQILKDKLFILFIKIIKDLDDIQLFDRSAYFRQLASSYFPDTPEFHQIIRTEKNNSFQYPDSSFGVKIPLSEAARLLGVTSQAIRSKILSGELKSERRGEKLLYVDVNDLKNISFRANTKNGVKRSLDNRH